MPRLITPYADYPQSGKSTMAQYLVDKYNFTRLSIATPLKRAVAAIGSGACDWSMVAQYDAMKDNPDPELGMLSPRDLMIAIGSAMRARDEDFWVDLCCRQIDYEFDCCRNVVVDDMRFPNEWDMFKNFNHIPVKIIKPTHGDENEMEGLLKDHTPDHIFRVEDGSHDKLYELTDILMERLA
jgi:hypothetical protein